MRLTVRTHDGTGERERRVRLHPSTPLTPLRGLLHKEGTASSPRPALWDLTGTSVHPLAFTSKHAHPQARALDSAAQFWGESFVLASMSYLVASPTPSLSCPVVAVHPGTCLMGTLGECSKRWSAVERGQGRRCLIVDRACEAGGSSSDSTQLHTHTCCVRNRYVRVRH